MALKKVHNKTVRQRDGLQFRIFFFFSAFALILAVFILLINAVISNFLYKTFKRNSMQNVGIEITENFCGECNRETMRDLANEENMGVIIFTYRGERPSFLELVDTVFVNDPYGLGYNAAAEEEIWRSQAGNSLLQGALGSPDGTYIGSNSDDSQLIVYAAPFEKDGVKYCIYAVTSGIAQENMARALSFQLVWIAGGAMILCLAISYLLSKRLTTPISNMSLLARRLAEGDYTVTFEGNGYNEIDELSDTLNYVTEELSKTEKLRKDMIANVSHDLKTPLTLIKASAEMLRDFPNAPEAKKAERLDTIMKEADRINKLVGQMTQLSLSESGVIKVERTEFNLSQLVGSVIESFQVRAEGYRLDVQIEPELYVFADYTQIQQVLYNFIDNAFKYCGEGKYIRLLLKKINNNVRFDCFDDGRGLSEDDKKRIWDRYYRTSSRYTRSQGTGLGLSIVKSILISHGATYGVNSVEGKGSDFYFELPLITDKSTNNDK